MLSPLKSHSTQEKGIYDNAFLSDVLCFFAGSRSGHVDQYGYSSSHYPNDPVRGWQLWDEFLKQNESYYPFHDEPGLIAEHIDEITGLCFGATQFVELGVGSVAAFEQKTLPLLRSMKPIKYVAADVNHDYAEDVVGLLHAKEPTISAHFQIVNFYETMPALETRSLLFLVGTTISNIQADLRYITPRQALIKALTNFAKALPQGSHFVFTFDANDNVESIMKAYRHKKLEDLNVNFIELIRRDLPTEGLHAEDFEHFMDWDNEAKLLTQEIRPVRDITFSVAGHTFSLKKHTRLHASNCFKFSEEAMRDAAQKAGFSDIRFHRNAASPMRLAILTK